MSTQDDLLKVYHGKSDDELLHLAAAPDQLTDEARVVLQGELSRRNINVRQDTPEDCESFASDAPRIELGRIVPTNRFAEQHRQSVSDFISEVLRTYRAHFWLFFKITAPAVMVSTVAIITARNEGREIARHLPRGADLLIHWTEYIEIWLANSSGWFVSWMAFSFAFGAICIATEEIISGFTPSARHSFLHIRERLGAFLRVCLLLLVLLLVIEVFAGLLVTGLLSVQGKVHLSGFLTWVVSYGILSSGLLLLSRFALAVPAVLLDDCRVGQAMFLSDELTQRKWLILAVLLAKSLVGSYVAARGPFWLASFIRVNAPVRPWFPWVLTTASIIGVTIIEPTMFVGFALLYLKMSAQRPAPSEVLTTRPA
jgi:hypothetical protein